MTGLTTRDLTRSTRHRLPIRFGHVGTTGGLRQTNDFVRISPER